MSTADEIRKLFPKLTYKQDYIIPNKAPIFFNSEEYRIGYFCFKYAVASVLKPKIIVELGVSWGNSAKAFLAACPKAKYIGVDSKYDESTLGFPLVEGTIAQLLRMGFAASLIEADTKTLIELPDADLIHIDADHSREGVDRELTLALNTKTPWILIDDSKLESVQEGIRDALDCYSGAPIMVMESFPETYTGNVLIGRLTA